MNATLTAKRDTALAIARTQPQPGTDARAFLTQRADAIRQAYGEIAPADTEAVTVNDLNIGDTLTELGNVTFPFPFTLTRILPAAGGRLLFAAHGWGSMRVVAGTERAVRLA